MIEKKSQKCLNYWEEKRDKIYYILTYLFALFTTFEVFKTEWSGITLLYADAFYFVFVLYSIYLFLTNRKSFIFDKNLRIIFIIYFLLVLSTLNALPAIIDISFDPPSMYGYETALKYVIRNVFQLIVYIIICFLGKNAQFCALRGYAYGFLSAIVVHSIYSIVQMVYMYGFFIDIHTQILESLGITKEIIQHDLVNYIGYPIFRNSGFHWDPAYFGLWGSIGLATFLFCNNWNSWIKLLTFIVGIAWIFSFSRSGYFAFLCGILIIIIGRHYNRTFIRINLKKIFQYTIIIGILCIGVYLFIPVELQDYIYDSFEYRFTYNPESKGTARHLLYPLYSIEGSLHDLWHFIFGYGPRNSSRGIAYGGNILDLTTNRVYDIESDICKMLLSYGIIGLILYLLFNYYIIKLYINRIQFDKNSILSYFYFFGIICTFFAGIFYMYNDSKWVWFLYLFGLLYLNYNYQSSNDSSFNNNCKF